MIIAQPGKYRISYSMAFPAIQKNATTAAISQLEIKEEKRQDYPRRKKSLPCMMPGERKRRRRRRDREILRVYGFSLAREERGVVIRGPSRINLRHQSTCITIPTLTFRSVPPRRGKASLNLVKFTV
jgi:hypothetical protein